MLKYVGLREGASKGTNPWSIRHALIYQKVDFDTRQTNHILVRIPENLENRLGESIIKDAEVAGVFVRQWVQLHSMSFGSVGDNLRQFINYLDEEVTSIVSPPTQVNCIIYFIFTQASSSASPFRV